MNRWLSFILAFGASALAGCADLGPRNHDLLEEVRAQRRAWEAWRPASYVYEVERLCFCGVEWRGPVRVRVDAGQVVGQEYVDGGESVTSAAAPWFPGVEGLFDILEDALDRDAHQVQVTWDPVSGAPQDFWIDYDANIADEEQGYRIVSAPRAPS